MMVMQPPLRGCVLKLLNFLMYLIAKKAAASARLCVETNIEKVEKYEGYAAASARLCVETTILP